MSGSNLAERISVGCPAWHKWPWLIHGSSTRNFKVEPRTQLGEIASLSESLGGRGNGVVYCRQRHTNHVAAISAEILEQVSGDGHVIVDECDGLVCTVPGITLAVFTADCVPVYLVDAKTRAIGIVHAGWRGSLARIAERAVELMVAAGSEGANLHAWIGPCIGGDVYEVSQEIADAFVREFPDTPAERPVVRGRHLDLAQLNAHQLVRGGIPAAQIELSGLCTIAERDHFYSYRGDGPDTGRIVSVIEVVAE